MCEHGVFKENENMAYIIDEREIVQDVFSSRYDTLDLIGFYRDILRFSF